MPGHQPGHHLGYGRDIGDTAGTPVGPWRGHRGHSLDTGRDPSGTKAGTPEGRWSERRAHGKEPAGAPPGPGRGPEELQDMGRAKASPRMNRAAWPAVTHDTNPEYEFPVEHFQEVSFPEHPIQPHVLEFCLLDTGARMFCGPNSMPGSGTCSRRLNMFGGAVWGCEDERTWPCETPVGRLQSCAHRRPHVYSTKPGPVPGRSEPPNSRPGPWIVDPDSSLRIVSIAQFSLKLAPLHAAARPDLAPLRPGELVWDHWPRFARGVDGRGWVIVEHLPVAALACMAEIFDRRGRAPAAFRVARLGTIPKPSGATVEVRPITTLWRLPRVGDSARQTPKRHSAMRGVQICHPQAASAVLGPGRRLAGRAWKELNPSRRNSHTPRPVQPRPPKGVVSAATGLHAGSEDSRAGFDQTRHQPQATDTSRLATRLVETGRRLPGMGFAQ